MAVGWMTTAITPVVVALAFAAVWALGGTRWFPRLPPGRPEDAPTRGDRLRYYAANVLALLAAAVAGVALAELTKLAPAERRYSAFDGPGRWIGPLLFALGAGCWLAIVLMDRFVRPGPLVNILHRANRGKAPGLDLRPAGRRLGLAVASAALVLHFGLRSTHTTLAAAGVSWRHWPWHTEQERPWTELREVRIVRTFPSMIGRIVERPHLGLEFADGLVLHVGRNDTRPAGFWEDPAAFAALRSGLAVQRVERD